MANNITAALTLKDQQFLSAINRATAATNTLATTADQNFRKVDQAAQRTAGSTEKLTRQFNQLRTVLLSAAVVGFAASSLRLADSIDDLSQSTGIAVDAIIRLQDAVSRAGGNAEAAAKGLQFFFGQIDSAASGSAKLQASFKDIGIGLDELRTLTEQQLFTRVVEQLAAMDAGSRKTALQAELLGKAYRNVVIDQDFVRNLREGNEETAKLAASVSRAAKLNEEFEASWTKLRLAFLDAFGPIISGLATIAENLNKLPGLVNVLSIALLAIPGALIGRAAISGLSFLAKGLFGVTKNAGKAKDAVKGVSEAAKKSKKNVDDAVKGPGPLRQNQNTTDAQVVRNRASVIGAAVGVGGGVAAAVIGGKNIEDRALKDQETQNKKQQALAQQQKNAQREVTDALRAKREEISRAAAEFNKQNKSIQDAIGLENQLIGSSKTVSETVRAQEELYKRSADEIQKLTAAKAAMSSEDRALGLGDSYDAEIDKIKQLTAVESERIARLVENANKLQQLDQFRQFALQTQIDLNRQLTQLQDDSAKSTLTELEKKYYDIAAAARDSAQAAIQAEEARRGEKLNTAEVAKYYAEASKGAEALRVKSKSLYDQSRSFSTGWKNAFNQYVESATNAAERAARIFNKFTQGIEDALVNFAKTGKLNWKQFVADMAEEVLRSQIRESLANLGTAFGLGDLFGKGSGQAAGTSPSNPLYVLPIGSGTGFGNAAAAVGGGGADPLGAFIKTLGIGQARGPSTTSGGGIGGGGGTLDNILNIGKSLLGGGGNLLSTIGSGIKSIFGGFFADGGRIPGGKFGLVGERGPEFIGGPANITPMGAGGGTSVTYNIQAVDAASFQALVARDPGFIHAVAEMGRSRLPGARR